MLVSLILGQIDENLCRLELSPSDRARQTARRKAIYLELHPETAQHVAGGKARQETASDNLSFAAATAEVTGRDQRTVQRDAERGEKVIDEVLDMIRGTKLDTGTYLDKAKRRRTGCGGEFNRAPPVLYRTQNQSTKS